MNELVSEGGKMPVNELTTFFRNLDFYNISIKMVKNCLCDLPDLLDG